MEEIYAIVAVVTMLLLFLSSGVVFAIINYKIKQRAYLEEKAFMQEAFQRQLMQASIEVQENTNAALSKELHDNVGQLLSSTKMLIGTVQRTMPIANEMLTLADVTLRIAVNEIRSLTKSLDKEWLEQFDLITNLQTEVQRINAAKLLIVNFFHPEKLPVEPQKQIILFRAVQEALQNAIKHADATEIVIIMQIEGKTLTVKVSDNGKGFQPNAGETGLGMKNMKHRIQLLEGKVQCNSESGSTIVQMDIPIHNL